MPLKKFHVITLIFIKSVRFLSHLQGTEIFFLFGNIVPSHSSHDPNTCLMPRSNLSAQQTSLLPEIRFKVAYNQACSAQKQQHSRKQQGTT